MFPKILYGFVAFALVKLASAQNVEPGQTSTATSTSSLPSTASMSTSTEAPPTTPAPPMARKPDWTVKGPMGSCILLAGNISLSVNYNTITNSTAFGVLTVPKTAVATGDCTGFLNKLQLTWPPVATAGATPAMPNTLAFMFIKRPVYDMGNLTGNGTYALTTVFGTVTADFPDAAPGQTFYVGAKTDGILSSDLRTSFKCMSAETVPADKLGKMQMTFVDVQAEAFHEGGTNDFGPEMVCTKDTVSGILPIVGYVAAGLLVAGAVGGFAYMKYRQAGYAAV